MCGNEEIEDNSLTNLVFSVNNNGGVLLDELTLPYQNAPSDLNELPLKILEPMEFETNRVNEQTLSNIDDLTNERTFLAPEKQFDETAFSINSLPYEMDSITGTSVSQLISLQNLLNPNILAEFFDADSNNIFASNYDRNTNSQLQKIAASQEEKKAFSYFAGLAQTTYCLRKKLNTTSGQYLAYGLPSKTGYLISFAGDEDELQKNIEGDGISLINYPDQPGAKIHKILYENYISFKDTLLSKVAKGVDLQPQKFRVLLLGYGLGGVYAQFAALDISKMLKTNHSLIAMTYGQPRFGNKELAIEIDKVAQVLRFTNKEDNIPRLPIKHKEVRFVHSGTEIWSFSKDEAVWCKRGNDDAGESQACINSGLLQNPEDHAGPYFSVLMTDCNNILK
ncbi:hypothetical protein G9A89_008473 [Geosiphon pyriformis]|nr:hypothetical protein G9A89_008473 [Geosiphon pyriformis]